MSTTLTSKGQVTILRRIRDELQLLPGSTLEFAVNQEAEVILRHPARPRVRERPARTASTPCAAVPTCAGTPTN